MLDAPRPVGAVTMYHALDINYRHAFYDAAQRPIPILNEGKPIEELF